MIISIGSGLVPWLLLVGFGRNFREFMFSGSLKYEESCLYLLM